MIRKLEDVGRVVIPSEMRKELGLKCGSPIRIELVNNKIELSNPENTKTYFFLVKRECKLQLIEQMFKSGEVDLSKLKKIVLEEDE